MRTKRKAIAIIKGHHVPIREQPPLRRMEFSEATAEEFGAGHATSIVRERLDNTSKLSPMPSSYLRIHALPGSLTAARKKGRRRRGYGYDPLSEDRPSDLDGN
jgi:hypothetical protein